MGAPTDRPRASCRSYIPEGECFYHFHTREQALRCLQGKWLLVSGGSNSIIFAMAIVNYLVPGLLDAARDSIATGILSFLDVILDAEGNVIKVTHEDWGTFAVVGRGTNALGAFDPAISDQLGAEFARESEGHTRITLLVACR